MANGLVETVVLVVFPITGFGFGIVWSLYAYATTIAVHSLRTGEPFELGDQLRVSNSEFAIIMAFWWVVLPALVIYDRRYGGSTEQE